MSRVSEVVFYGCCILGGLLIAQQLYTLGYVNGFVYAAYGRDTSYVKKRIVKEGNILKYPFGNEGGQAEASSDSDSVCESGQEPEKEGA